MDTSTLLILFGCGVAIGGATAKVMSALSEQTAKKILLAIAIASVVVYLYLVKIY
jgi:F0F1-type ATP synthase membrane subunit c/vacuolar-type H+-ATPase subunit K